MEKRMRNEDNKPKHDNIEKVNAHTKEEATGLFI